MAKKKKVTRKEEKSFITIAQKNYKSVGRNEK